MKHSELVEAFVARCRADRQRLLGELRSYHPIGVMRLWRGRSADSLREVTAERVAALERELAGLEATIEFAAAIANLL